MSRAQPLSNRPCERGLAAIALCQQGSEVELRTRMSRTRSKAQPSDSFRCTLGNRLAGGIALPEVETRLDIASSRRACKAAQPAYILSSEP